LKNASGWDNWQEDIICSNCKNWNAEYRSKTACHVCQDTRVNGKKTHSGNGTNSTGFSGLPGGERVDNGSFIRIGSNGLWWTSIESKEYSAWQSVLYNDIDAVFLNDSRKAKGLSVRCLRD
jgi:uncharacterized protein (TIGR02145 family)